MLYYIGASNGHGIGFLVTEVLARAPVSGSWLFNLSVLRDCLWTTWACPIFRPIFQHLSGFNSYFNL